MYFNVDPSVVVFFSGKPIFQDKLLGNVGDFNVDIFGIYHWHVKGKILMSMVNNWAPLHDLILLSMSLMSSKDAVLVPMSPG